MKPSLLLGAPGTGKTYQLVQSILERKPKQFALVTFTRRAAKEAKDRLKQYYSDKELKYVRTIHSLCFELLGLKQTQVFTSNDLFKFGQVYGYEFTFRSFSQEDGTYYGMTDDDIEYRSMMINRAKLIQPDMFESGMARSYDRYKAEHQLVDFHDMISMVVDGNIGVGQIDLLCIDEIQDLTPLQMQFAYWLYHQSKDVIFAGDGNQMIFEWAGVDRREYNKLIDQCDVEVLVKNYRLPKEIKNKSLDVLGKKHLTDLTRLVDNSVIYADMFPEINSNESYLILGRNNYIIKSNMMQVDEMEPFRWAWLSSIDQLGHKEIFNVFLSTIHGAKGSEANNVILFTDVSPATYEQIDSDAEKRVWYVGITRARKKLYIIEPQTDLFYDLS